MASPRPAASALVERLRVARDRRAAGAPEPGRGRHPGSGHHVHRLPRRAGHRPGMADGHHSRSDRCIRMGSHRARPEAAPERASTASSTTCITTAASSPTACSPRSCCEGSVNLRAECHGMSPKFGVWAHICGSDLVRDADGVVHVLEDNLRVPSGVSYLLQNRAISKRAFADLFERQSILPVDDYPDQLRPAAPVAGCRRASRPSSSAGRRAHPGRVQQRLLRARVPRPADGRAVGRGRRPVRRPERQRVDAHDRRPEAGRRDLPPDRRPVPRPRGVPARFCSSACPA